MPVQISISLPEGYKLRTITYASIQIDEKLDDDLFSLEVPEGYRPHGGKLLKPLRDDDKAKLLAKMMYLIKACFTYAQAHDGQFPERLADLHAVGVTDEVLRKVLAAPDQPDGPAVIQYRRPRADADGGSEVMLYEIYEQWPAAGIAVGFADAHCSVIVEQERFEELLR